MFPRWGRRRLWRPLPTACLTHHRKVLSTHLPRGMCKHMRHGGSPRGQRTWWDHRPPHPKMYSVTVVFHRMSQYPERGEQWLISGCHVPSRPHDGSRFCAHDPGPLSRPPVLAPQGGANPAHLFLFRVMTQVSQT